ncbi:MAG: hypothetical protein EOO99_10230 [Pedobacter sp.]|nr:MAG: hypothetical protein EOO99_10230 [Pedobacter sp.]
MDIIASIIKLLAQQKSVEVASIGTWYQKKNPGKFDPNTQSFNPPTFSIHFQKLENGDDTLVNFLINEKTIAKEEAISLINKFTQQVWEQLNEQQLADLSPLGQLYFENNNLQFKEGHNFSSPNQFFGLPKSFEENLSPSEDRSLNDASTAFETIKEENPSPSEVFENIAPVSDSPKEIEQQPETKSLLPTDEVWKPTVNQKYEYDPVDDEDDLPPRRSIFKWIIYIIIILAVLSTLAYIFYPRYFDDLYNRINPPKYQIEEAPIIDTPTKSVSELIKADSIALDSLKNAMHLDSINKTQITTYEVIGAAMKTEKKADEIINNFTRRGIVAKKLYNTGGKLIKISLGSYTDINTASFVKDSLRKSLKNPDIYIQTVKPKN